MATMPIPGESTFTAPHPVSQNEVTFDITKRRHGVCKFFNSQKGFGFINDDHPDELGNQEVFVHYTNITGKGGFRSLAEGEEVEYVVAPGDKGWQAAEVSGPSGRAVQGDPKAKLPKGPAFMPYPTNIGMIPYAIGGQSPFITDPYIQQQAGVYASPYNSHLVFVPAPGYAAGAMSPQAMQGVGGMRSPQQGYGQPGMALSPQLAAGFGGFPVAGYGGIGAIGNHAGVGAGGEMRSPVATSGAFGQQNFGMASSGLGLRGDGSSGRGNGGAGGERDEMNGRGGGGVGGRGDGQSGGFNAFGQNSLLYSSGGQGNY